MFVAGGGGGGGGNLWSLGGNSKDGNMMNGYRGIELGTLGCHAHILTTALPSYVYLCLSISCSILLFIDLFLYFSLISLALAVACYLSIYM